MKIRGALIHASRTRKKRLSKNSWSTFENLRNFNENLHFETIITKQQILCNFPIFNVNTKSCRWKKSLHSIRFVERHFYKLKKLSHRLLPQTKWFFVIFRWRLVNWHWAKMLHVTGAWNRVKSERKTSQWWFTAAEFPRGMTHAIFFRWEIKNWASKGLKK